MLQLWRERLLESALGVIRETPRGMPDALRESLNRCVGHSDHLELSLLACAASMWCGEDPSLGMPVAVASLMLRAGISVHLQLPGFRERIEGFPVLLEEADPASAILCGDGLVAMAMEHLSANTGRRSQELVTDAVEAIGSGGVLAGVSREMSDVSVPTLPDGRRTWEMLSGQISRFTSRGGALLAGATGSMLDDAAMTGLLIGRARFLADGCFAPSMEGLKGKVSVEAGALAEQAEAITGHGPEAAMYSSIMYFAELSGA